MIKRLLVPLDGSHLAEAALPYAQLIARAAGASVTLAHFIEAHAPHDIHGEPHLHGADEATRYLADAPLRSFGKEIDVSTHVHAAKTRDVAASIVDHACEFAADLIVMCTHGRHGLRELVIGSIAQHVIGSGRYPVLLIQPQPERPTTPARLARILTALDGDPVHERALPVIAEFARALRASLHLLTVVPTLGTLAGPEAATGMMLPAATAAMLEMAEAEARARLVSLAGAWEAEGLAATVAVRRGEPAASIALEAARADVDLIALGTHGKAGMNAFWSGSVAPHLPSLCDLPLLLIPVHDS